MTKNQIIFYISIALTTLITEIGNNYGIGGCVFPPLMLMLVVLGLKAFPTPPKENK